MADQIKEARSFGDLSENSEYDEAKNEQGKLSPRIAEVGEHPGQLRGHRGDMDRLHSVRLGSKVKVLDLEFEEEESYQVVGSQEADPMNGRISEDSPFGKALLGNAVGDEVQVEAPCRRTEVPYFRDSKSKEQSHEHRREKRQPAGGSRPCPNSA